MSVVLEPVVSEEHDQSIEQEPAANADYQEQVVDEEPVKPEPKNEDDRRKSLIRQQKS